MGAIHSRPRRDKRPGPEMRSIPQGTRRINSKSSGLREAVHSKAPRDKEQVTHQGTGWAGPWVGTATTPSSTLTPGTSRYWSFISLCTLHMHIHNKINCIVNAFLLYLTYLNFFACLCWLAPTLLAKLPVSFYAFQKEFVLASSNLLQSDLKNAKVSIKRHLNCVICTYFTSFHYVHT